MYVISAREPCCSKKHLVTKTRGFQVPDTILEGLQLTTGLYLHPLLLWDFVLNTIAFFYSLRMQVVSVRNVLFKQSFTVFPYKGLLFSYFSHRIIQ